MFIVTNKHIAPLARLEVEIGRHLAWLERYRDQGKALAYGVNAANDGGFILMSHVDEPELQSILDEDPFKQLQLVEYDYLEVKVLSGIDGLKEGKLAV